MAIDQHTSFYLLPRGKLPSKQENSCWGCLIIIMFREDDCWQKICKNNQTTKNKIQTLNHTLGGLKLGLVVLYARLGTGVFPLQLGSSSAGVYSPQQGGPRFPWSLLCSQCPRAHMFYHFVFTREQLSIWVWWRLQRDTQLNYNSYCESALFRTQFMNCGCCSQNIGLEMCLKKWQKCSFVFFSETCRAVYSSVWFFLIFFLSPGLALWSSVWVWELWTPPGAKLGSGSQCFHL